VKLSPRNKNSAEPAGDVPSEPTAAPVGKGRPTPKRSAAAPQRGPVTPPKTRREAYARKRDHAKTARRTPSPAASMSVTERRAALKRGDATVLPRRDQGATRKLARDFVDSRRMLSNYLLLLFPLMIIATFVKQLAILDLVVFGMFALLLLEWYVTGRRIRALAVERLGKADGGNMTIGMYAGNRAFLPRRWRLPAPQVRRGDQI
jgi:Protein of unknown function (DUF3043)